MKFVFSKERALSIAKKEVKHILRDPFTLVVALVIPVFLTTMFGFAMNFDIRNVRTAVFDSDLTQSSRMVLDSFSNSKYFKIVDTKLLTRYPDELLAREDARVAIIIPHKFEENLFNGRGGKIQILLDGSDNTSASLITGYIAGVQESINKRYANFEQYPSRPVKLFPRFLFNPEQESSWFIVPGLSVVILAILSILLTALTIAREWETGSMELLLSTPARPAEIIAGKLLPYIGLCFIGLGFVYAAARIVFGVPFTGSHVAYMVISLIFLGSYLSLGLLISVTARKQQLAMQMSILAGYMPSILLSGFIFPIENMTPFWKTFTAIFPARWYMTACRATYLKGAGLVDLVVPLSALLILFLILFSAATKRFRGDLEK